MKITKAHFENFEGFYTGMNIRTLDIDFSKCNDSHFVMIFGKNFSGKSTLISHLQPFPGSNDDRKKTIIDGEEGRKILEYRRKDGAEFKIDIRYPIQKGDKKTAEKCFFYEKNEKGAWVNLNANGGVESYTRLIEEKLFITKDFFAVGRIGGVSNFIDFSKSERKKYITEFLPNLDPYLSAHEIVSKKFTAVKKLSATFADELLKLRPAEECAAAIVKTESTITDLQESIKSNQLELGGAKTSIDNILKETDESIPELRVFARTGRNEISDSIEKETEILMKMKELSMPGLTEESGALMIKEQDEIILANSKEESSLETDIANISHNISEKNLDLQSRETTLNSMKLQERRIREAKENIEKLGKDLTSFMDEKKKYTKPIFAHFDSMTSTVLGTLREQITEMKMYLMDLRSKSRAAGIEFTGDGASSASIMGAIGEARKKSAEASKILLEIDSNEKIVSENSQKIKREEILDKRPAGCKINTCPFIADALSCKGAKEAFETASKRLEELNPQKETMESQKERSLEKLKFLENFKSMFSTFSGKFVNYPLLRLIFRIHSIVTEEESFIKAMNISEDEFMAIFDITEIIDYVNLINNITEIRNKKFEAEQHYKDMEGTSGLILDLNSKILSLKSNIQDMTDKLDGLKAKYDTVISRVKKASEVKKNIEYSLAALSKIREKESLITGLKEKNDKMTKYLGDITKNRDIMTTVNKTLSELNEKLSLSEKEKIDLSHEISKRRETEEKLESLKKEYSILENVKNATDTVKGIPVYLSTSYLEDIRQRANHLLNICFKGDFLLGKFVINEKEFTIPVLRGNGSRLEDATIGSGAEVSFLKEAISFAIIEKSIGGYNILYLDEIDGVLDESNRRNFIQMLNRQVEDLDIEQVFIISHNREFMGEELNMILLKDNGIDQSDETLMSNKVVLFDYNKK